MLDLCRLISLPLAAFEQRPRECGRVPVPDGCRATEAGVADALIAHLAERDFPGVVRSVRAVDTYVPLGPAANAVLVSEEQIVRGAADVCVGSPGTQSADSRGSAGSLRR